MPASLSDFQKEWPKLIIMRIALGADHAGFELKQHVLAFVRELGHEAIDLGTNGPSPVDYPDFAAAVGLAVRDKKADRGVVVCGSGVGACVAANKLRGVRACVCHDTYSAHQGVEHDDMNVLVLGGRIIGSELARELVRSFLGASFSNEERHARRLGKVIAIEEREGRR
jgi:RpiB/LacA/LacB family sugar-phosphate isomerase